MKSVVERIGMEPRLLDYELSSSSGTWHTGDGRAGGSIFQATSSIEVGREITFRFRASMGDTLDLARFLTSPAVETAWRFGGPVRRGRGLLRRWLGQ